MGADLDRAITGQGGGPPASRAPVRAPCCRRYCPSSFCSRSAFAHREAGPVVIKIPDRRRYSLPACRGHSGWLRRTALHRLARSVGRADRWAAAGPPAPRPPVSKRRPAPILIMVFGHGVRCPPIPRVPGSTRGSGRLLRRGKFRAFRQWRIELASMQTSPVRKTRRVCWFSQISLMPAQFPAEAVEPQAGACSAQMVDIGGAVAHLEHHRLAVVDVKR